MDTVFEKNKPNLTELVNSTFSLTLVPTHECKKLPESIPLGLTPWQEPEKREEAELEAAAKDTMHRLNFNSKSGARSVSSDKEAHQSTSRRQDSTNSLVSRDGQVFEFQFSPLSHDQCVLYRIKKNYKSVRFLLWLSFFILPFCS